jgi:hypothetical protein
VGCILEKSQCATNSGQLEGGDKLYWNAGSTCVDGPVSIKYPHRVAFVDEVRLSLDLAALREVCVCVLHGSRSAFRNRARHRRFRSIDPMEPSSRFFQLPPERPDPTRRKLWVNWRVQELANVKAKLMLC